MTDFSGEWVLNKEASVLSPGADGVRSAVWRIEHRDPTFHLTASFATDGAPIQFEFELLTDGNDVVGTHEGVTIASRLQWEDNALVVTMRTERPDGAMTVSFRYELVDDGRRLRAVERLRGTDHDQDNVWVFDRGPR